MQINFDLDKKEATVINFFEDELYSRLDNFSLGEIQQDVLLDTLKNSEGFLERVIELVYFKLGLDFDDFVLNMKNHSDTSDYDGINSLIENQLHHVKMVLIDFLFKQLPFNYILTLAREKKITLWNLEEVNLRELLIGQLQMEIEKVHNVNDTTDLIQNSLSSIVQLNQFVNIKNKINNRSNKVIIENKLIMGIIDEMPLENLRQIFTDILSDDTIQRNLL